MWSNLIEQLRFFKNTISSYLHNKPISGCLWFFFLLSVVLIFIMAIWADIFPQWVGFGAYDEVRQGARAKTLWDWMDLLIVPATLASGVFLLGKWQADNERKKTLDDQRQTMLDSYLGKMTELLLDKDLRGANEEICSIANAITRMLFRRLNGDRKGDAIQFLFEAGLINNSNPVIDVLGLNLDKSILTGASLIAVNLAGTHCVGANLNNAKFTDSVLTGCTFSNSEMQGVDFTNTSLVQAILTDCILIDADFSNADLEEANFTNASVTLKQLEKAKSLKNMILPDGRVYQVQQGE